ncbi:MAG: adenosylmethionine decarboxylase [Chloroflexi bacterium]|nr:adenosylmethionine decarboxylase [Chloroflexota bacterium]
MALGRHLLIELHECSEYALDDERLICETLVRSAEQLRSTVLSVSSHKFQPMGVTAIVMIAESHLTIHTWPEHAYAAVDIFTCSPTMRPTDVVDFIAGRVRARRVETREIERGVILQTAGSVA